MYHGRFGLPALPLRAPPRAACRPPGGFGAAPPAAAPHRVQKRAPATRSAPHSLHWRAVSDAPQEGQNLPLDSVPQFAHFMVMRIGSADPREKRQHAGRQLAVDGTTGHITFTAGGRSRMLAQ